MPREIVHWLVLEQTLKRLAADNLPFARQCLVEERAASYMGAVVHDAPYYYKFGRDSFEEMADWLHGKKGEDTLLPIRMLIARILKGPEADKPLLWSLLLGMLTHIATDVVFHPMVFYFTGNYHDSNPQKQKQARCRHRLFEVYLDSWFLAEIGNPAYKKLNTVLYELNDKISILQNLLELGILPENQIYNSGQEGKKWGKAINYLSKIQALMVSPTAGLLIRSINKLTGGRISEIDALFSYCRAAPEKFFDQPLYFQNPVTGEHFQLHVRELFEQAIVDSLFLIRIVEPLISKAETDIESLFAPLHGRSLNLGVENTGVDKAVFFSEQGVPIAGLF